MHRESLFLCRLPLSPLSLWGLGFVQMLNPRRPVVRTTGRSRYSPQVRHWLRSGELDAYGVRNVWRQLRRLLDAALPRGRISATLEIPMLYRWVSRWLLV